ncbi:hypothetical protein NDU88_005360 [Pleurodeles waltl]|uniref:Calcitonin peptide-like domain-containing protein n=2 Tax=Pleurodeles waltl TaxID=8319 RepID=A0AAV7SLJ4_PLEWA|nr:hypothetical protein NDU88_005360 [Pleurodeles waltl]
MEIDDSVSVLSDVRDETALSALNSRTAELTWKERMCHLNLPALLIALSVTLSCREAAPIERLVSVSDDLSAGTSDREGWILPVLTKTTLLGLNRATPQIDTSKIKSRRMEKRKCNTATCVTQRLADYLVRSGNNIGTIYSPTNVGSYTYGKRDGVGLLSREPVTYVQF